MIETQRSASLDGIRGLAALSVFAFHLWLYGTVGDRRLSWGPVLIQFRTGLICFFVLSGYLLYRAFGRAAVRQAGTVPWRRYAWRRTARILPAYYAALLGTLALLGGAQHLPGVRFPDYSDLPLYAIFGQNYSSETILKLDPVTWTLCLEAAFYVLLPVLGLFAYHVGRGRRGPQIGMCLALVAVGLGWHWAGYDLEASQLWTKALPAYLPYFGLGMLAAVLLEARSSADGPSDLNSRTTALMVAAAVVLVVGNSYWHANSAGGSSDAWVAILQDIPAGSGFALLIAAAAAGRGPAVAWLRMRWLSWSGLISYGIYLWQVPLILFAQRLGITPGDFWGLLAVALPLTIVAGAASWYLIERPALSLVARRLRLRPAAT